MNVTPAMEISLEEVNKTEGAILLEYGAGWCEYCRAAQDLIASALAKYPNIKHIKIEDGKGRALGRTFTVKLWPAYLNFYEKRYRSKKTCQAF